MCLINIFYLCKFTYLLLLNFYYGQKTWEYSLVVFSFISGKEYIL